eukprot:COSAG01_NODE_52855_length_343_cov_1.270492_1_plen_21_part_10
MVGAIDLSTNAALQKILGARR